MQSRRGGRGFGLMESTSLQRWLTLMFLAFSLLVITSVGLTLWGLDAQKQDAQLINLAGRQRMLVQQMAGLALMARPAGEPQYQAGLLAAANTFDRTLAALRHGGVVTDDAGHTLTLSPPADPSLISALDNVDAEWQTFRGQLGFATGAKPGISPADPQAIEASAAALVDGADQVVGVYGSLSAAKAASLHWIQAGFLVCAVALLGLGWWLIRRAIVRPLDELNRSAGQIGAGDLDTAIRGGGPMEIRRLGNTLETMRSELLRSRRELTASVNTLEERVNQRTQELEALATVSQDISSRLDIGEVLKSVTEKAQLLLGSEVAFLCLLDRKGQVLNLQSAVGPEAAVVKSASAVQPEISTQVFSGQTAVPCGLDCCPGFCAIMHPAYRASHLAVRLRTGDQVIGALCVGGTKPRMFGPEAVLVLTQLAGIAAVALENSHLYEQAEHRAALEERQQIAAEIHDGLLQTLGYLRWMVGLSSQQLSQGDVSRALATFQNIERAEQQAEIEMRRAIASLQEDFPVRSTLQELLAELVTGSGAWPAPRVQWDNHVNPPVLLSRSDGEQVLRVAREALLNARQHGQAESAVVSLDKVDGELVLSVADNGSGFKTDRPAARERLPGERPHFGLKIMEARASRLGGRVTVESTPGQGTRVTLRWPLVPPGGCQEHLGQ